MKKINSEHIAAFRKWFYSPAQKYPEFSIPELNVLIKGFKLADPDATGKLQHPLSLSTSLRFVER